MYKVSPNSDFSATITRTTMSFQVPSLGFLQDMYLAFKIFSTAGAGAESAWAGASYIEEVNVSARGHPLRRCDDLAIIWDSVLAEENATVKANRIVGMRQAKQTTTVNADHAFYIDLGKALGLRAPKDSYDTITLEPLTVNVIFRAPSDCNSCANAQYPANSCYLYCVYHQLEASEFLAFQNEMYSSDKPTKRLISSWEKETDKTFTGTQASQEVNVDVNHKGLLKETIIAVSDKDHRDAGATSTDKDRFALNPIAKITLYCSGVRVAEIDNNDLHTLLRCKAPKNYAVTKNILTPQNDDPQNVYCLDYSQMNLDDGVYDKISGCLNTGDLSSCYLTLTLTSAQANDYVVRVNHRTYRMESIEGRSGMVSSSAKV